MQASDSQLFEEHARSNWVRLRTLMRLRWVAICGQSIAVVVAVQFLNLQIASGPVFATIGALVLANLVFSFVYPVNKRLSEREAFIVLTFDVLQLAALLFLTGGLNNPFAVLLLAPVTIAATVLRLGNTLLLGGVAIALVTLLAWVSFPLVTSSGQTLALPTLFLFGFWAAMLIGLIFLASYARQVTVERQVMSEALLATQLALSRSQKLTDLGGVVAAAAHELGTPLATIKLVSSELLGEVSEFPELNEDLTIIGQQADRCRDILRNMGQAGKDDLHLQQAPIEAVVREAAEPHIGRGKQVLFDVAPESDNESAQPIVLRRPETIHGLRNLIQNAVDFAHERIEIDVTWTANLIVVRIADDGPGFPSSVIGRIGDPFVRQRKVSGGGSRPGYEGMGLGLFIAKTLLERSGARLRFANGRVRKSDGWTGQTKGGAVVTVSWSRGKTDITNNAANRPLGENQPIG